MRSIRFIGIALIGLFSVFSISESRASIRDPEIISWNLTEFSSTSIEVEDTIFENITVKDIVVENTTVFTSKEVIVNPINGPPVISTPTIPKEIGKSNNKEEFDKTLTFLNSRRARDGLRTGSNNS